MKNHNIRRVRPEDIETLIKLCAEHAEFEKASYEPEGKASLLAQELFAENPRVHCLVAEDKDGTLIGYATWAHEFSTWDAKQYVHVDCLYLRPEVRYRGVGVALAKQMAKDVVAMGTNGLPAQWQTPPFNSHAIQFYEAIGAKRKDKARFYIAQEDVLKLAGAA